MPIISFCDASVFLTNVFVSTPATLAMQNESVLGAHIPLASEVESKKQFLGENDSRRRRCRDKHRALGMVYCDGTENSSLQFLLREEEELGSAPAVRSPSEESAALWCLLWKKEVDAGNCSAV